MCLVALCIDEEWGEIETLVTTKGFMGMGRKKKSPIGFERVVKTLAKQNIKAPNDVCSYATYMFCINVLVSRFYMYSTTTRAHTHTHTHTHQILTKYLAEIEDIELRLQLATEVQVFDVGLECLKLLRDKERVRGYINHIPSNKHWEFRKKIETLLSNSVSSLCVCVCVCVCACVCVCVCVCVRACVCV